MQRSPSVSVVVTAFLKQNQKYLDLLIESVNRQSYPKQLIDTVVITPPGYEPSYGDHVRVLHPADHDQYSNARATNHGFQMSNQSSKYVLYLNDDTILTEHAIRNLVACYERTQGLGLLMPIGNDQQGRYALFTGFHQDGGFNLFSGPLTYDQMAENKENLMRAESPYAPGIFLYDELCLYAFLIKRSLYNEVGPFDERFVRTGPDDIDYSRRVAARGARSAICLDAVIWHAGGVSANLTMTDETRKENAIRMRQKWNPTEADLRQMDFIGE